MSPEGIPEWVEELVGAVVAATEFKVAPTSITATSGRRRRAGD